MISFNALSTSIENCRFNEIGSNKHAIFYTSSYTEDLERSLTTNSCNFTQTLSTVDSLVYFNTKISSKFVFTYNNIKFTDNISHVLGCNANILIQEDEEKYWVFHNNTLDPNDEVVIKTSDAEKIPAKFGGRIYIFSNLQSCDFQINQCIFESNAAELTALFGAGAMYLQTLNSKLIRCTFRKNVGINVKIYQTDNLDPPSSNSLLLNSESSIRVSECTFESDKDSSTSSLFFVDKKIRNKTPLAVVN